MIDLKIRHIQRHFVAIIGETILRYEAEAAKRPEMIKWADGRASLGLIPKLVQDEWGIDLEGKH